MNIAIIGKGRVGSALAQALGRAGHRVNFGQRRPQPGQKDETSITEAVRDAEVTILAVPYDAVHEVIAAADGFAGKIIVDATNPLTMTADGLALSLGFETSGAERIAALAPKGRLFKAFNQTGFENMADASVYSGPLVMFVAGDDGAAKPIVLRLVADAGFQPIDVGPLRSARLLEPLAMLWIDLALKHQQGTGFALTLQKKA
jgi:hypothetical protein